MKKLHAKDITRHQVEQLGSITPPSSEWQFPYYPLEGPLHDPEITIRQLSDVLISVNGDRNDQTFISHYSSATADVRRQFDEYYKVYFKIHKKR